MQFALCARTRLCVWIPVQQLLRSSLPFSTIYRVCAVALYRPDLSAFIQPPSSLNIVPRVNSFQFPVVAFGRYLLSILNLHEDRKITTLSEYIPYQHLRWLMIFSFKVFRERLYSYEHTMLVNQK